MLQAPAVSAFSQRQILAHTLEAAEKAEHYLDAVCAAIRPGMTEADARQMALDLAARFGIEKHWHRPYIRFGPNSTLTFMDKPTREYMLQDSDIAYVDLGPVIRTGSDGLEVEGDVGRTLVFGDNPLFHHLKAHSERLNALARRYWQDAQPTGVELYEALHRWSAEAGLIFHLNPAGHLIGSFPHTGWKEGLNTYPYVPEPGVWILEIQVRHPYEPYGAFYEAVLI